MTFRFSETGPTFPGDLVDSMLAGDVVFLCGTGVSAPEMPTFKELVERVSASLGEPLSASEALACNDQRYEEALGSLSRRMADPAAVNRAAAAALAIGDQPQLDHHRTVLRLSRDLNNRILVVTTNFETLLERAIARSHPEIDPAMVSFAGQALPAPGGSNFAGIIHLHGRLADETLRIGATPLVMTSADYGDAYMRGAWASRFLFDLARCKTIVLIGYSAGDAPVRYFLNVLEADRERFPDLKKVFAFTPYVDDPMAAELPWGTVAVAPITYCEINPITGRHDHSPLWSDLAELAALVEKPRQRREERLRAIVETDPGEAKADFIDELRWLLSGGSEPWPVLIDTIQDPQWFNVLQDNGLWTANDASWIIPAWIATDPMKRSRVTTAVAWLERLGSPLLDWINRRIQQANDLTPGWKRAWRQFANATASDQDRFDDNAFVLGMKLASGIVLDADLQRAVDTLAPVLKLRPPFRGYFLEETQAAPIADDAEPDGIGELTRIDFGRLYDVGSKELIDGLVGLEDRADRILRLATDALASALATAVELDLIKGDGDFCDWSVPAIDEHRQNDHHSGLLPIVRLASAVFSRAAANDRSQARIIAATWPGMPGRIGTRLMLNAMRNVDAYDADEAISFVAAVDETTFWDIRRELALVLRERGGSADPQLRGQVERRILDTGKAFYSRYDIEEGQPDWREHALDNAVWLLLSQLEVADALTDAGRTELAGIKRRREHLNRLPVDRDLFSSWVGEASRVVGDVEPIASAAPDGRLSVVLEQIESPDIERRHGWSTYCQIDPQGAFDTLAAADLSAVNLPLWSTLLTSLSHGQDSNSELRSDLITESIDRLRAVPDEDLDAIASPIVDALFSGPRGRIQNREDWYDRLWVALAADDQVFAPPNDLSGAALNTAAGRFANTLIKEFEESLKAGSELISRQRERLMVVASAAGRPGAFARAMMVQDFGFLFSRDQQFVVENLAPWFNDPTEGPGLRSVLIIWASITPDISKAVPGVLLQAATEATVGPDGGGRGPAGRIAAVLLRPAIAELRHDDEPQWGFGVAEVRAALREASATVRKAALDVLAQWMRLEEGGVEQAWATMVYPVIEEVWPKERSFVDANNNMSLAFLAIGAGQSFPAALLVVKPFINPIAGGRASLHAIQTSTVPRDHPRQTLDLLWMLFGPVGPTSYDLPKLLAAMTEAEPALEVDRRLQSLGQRAPRF